MYALLSGCLSVLPSFGTRPKVAGLDVTNADWRHHQNETRNAARIDRSKPRQRLANGFRVSRPGPA